MLTAARMLSQRGIDFSALDKQPVYSVFLLLSPEDKPEEHLQAMEVIFKNLSKETFRRFLRQATTTDEVMTLLLAGHETSALGLTWMLYELARHPEVDVELATEIARGLRAGQLPGASDLPNLPVAASIVKETLRLYPPLYVMGREPLDDIEICGQELKKGSRLRFNSFRQQRDAILRVQQQKDELMEIVKEGAARYVKNAGIRPRGERIYF